MANGAMPSRYANETPFLGILKIVVWDDVSLASVEMKDTLLGTTNHPLKEGLKNLISSSMDGMNTDTLNLCKCIRSLECRRRTEHFLRSESF